jgi:hypothetical protein
MAEATTTESEPRRRGQGCAATLVLDQLDSLLLLAVQELDVEPERIAGWVQDTLAALQPKH